MRKAHIVRDIVGKQFGSFTVIGEAPKRPGNKATMCTVRCVCGKENQTPISRVLRLAYAKKCMACSAIERGQRRIKEHLKTYDPKVISAEMLHRLKPHGKTHKRAWDEKIDVKLLQDIFTKQNFRCALSGRPIAATYRWKDHGKHKTIGNASLDRIDSTKDYTTDNIQFVDREINYLKCNYSEDAFFAIIKQIYEYRQLQTFTPKNTTHQPLVELHSSDNQ